jgi:hypothetical protein
MTLCTLEGESLNGGSWKGQCMVLPHHNSNCKTATITHCCGSACHVILGEQCTRPPAPAPPSLAEPAPRSSIYPSIYPSLSLLCDMFTIERSSSLSSSASSTSSTSNTMQSLRDGPVSFDDMEGTRPPKCRVTQPTHHTPLLSTSGTIPLPQHPAPRRSGTPIRHANPFRLPPSLDPAAQRSIAQCSVGRTSNSPQPPPTPCSLSTTSAVVRSRIVKALMEDAAPLRNYEAVCCGTDTIPVMMSTRVASGLLGASTIPDQSQLKASATHNNDSSEGSGPLQRCAVATTTHTREDPTLPVGTFSVEDGDDADGGGCNERGDTHRPAGTTNTAAWTPRHTPSHTYHRGLSSRSKTMRRVRFVSPSRKQRKKQLACGKQVTDTFRDMDRNALAKLLAENKLIDANTKAPEPVLRDIAQGVFLPDGSSGC